MHAVSSQPNDRIRGAVVRYRRRHAPVRSAVRAVLASLLAASLCPMIGAAAANEPLKLPARSSSRPHGRSSPAGRPMITSRHLPPIRQAAKRPAQWQGPRRSATDRGALATVCRKTSGLAPQDAQAARRFFEENFEPVRIARLGEAAGLLTGYFEPWFRLALSQPGVSRPGLPPAARPRRRRPQAGIASIPNKGVRIGRRNAQGELVPYYDRAAIEAGALDGQKLEICWLKDPADLSRSRSRARRA